MSGQKFTIQTNTKQTSQRINKISSRKVENPHYYGHRARLRQRFINAHHSLFNYELLELILGLTIPHRDVKALAKDLLNVYGNLHTTINAPVERLSSFRSKENGSRLTDITIITIKVVGAIIARTTYFLPKRNTIDKLGEFAVVTSKKEDARDYCTYLSQRFLTEDIDSFTDDELLEWILLRVNLRQNIEQLAMILLYVHGNLKNIIHTPIENLRSFKWQNKTYHLSLVTSVALLVIGEIALRKHNIIGCQILRDWGKIEEFCYELVWFLKKEECHLIFLDKKNTVIKEEIQQSGTIDYISIYPREIIERSLQIGASSIVIIHNHPSGDPSPSKDDLSMTYQVKQALQLVRIDLFDHLIIGSEGIYSFKNNGLL